MLRIILCLLFILPQHKISSVNLKDLDGKTVQIKASAAGKASIVIFISPECPLCESYSLTLNKLMDTYAGKDFIFYGIVPGKSFSKKAVLEFRKKYHLERLQFRFDPNLELTHALHATITPEVIVLSREENVLYQGRIDNWAYELGRKRSVITEHDLKNVLQNIQQSASFKPYQTKAVGCFIE